MERAEELHSAPLFPTPSPLPSDNESLASTSLPYTLDTSLADAEASNPLEATYLDLCTRRATLMEVVSSLQQGSLRSHSVAEKRETVTELKTELREILGDVAALKQTLKDLLGL